MLFNKSIVNISHGATTATMTEKQSKSSAPLETSQKEGDLSHQRKEPASPAKKEVQDMETINYWVQERDFMY